MEGDTYRTEVAERVIRLNLIRLRRSAGLTQAQLAARIGLTVGAVAMWEQGLRSPSAAHAVLVVKALGVSCDDLLTAPPTG